MKGLFFAGAMGGMGGMGDMGGFGGMGGMPRAAQGQPGADEQIQARITFEEAVFGTKKEVDVNRLSSCETCSGSGVKAGTTPQTCSECSGSGRTVSVRKLTLFRYLTKLKAESKENALVQNRGIASHSLVVLLMMLELVC